MHKPSCVITSSKTSQPEGVATRRVAPQMRRASRGRKRLLRHASPPPPRAPAVAARDYPDRLLPSTFYHFSQVLATTLPPCPRHVFLATHIWLASARAFQQPIHRPLSERDGSFPGHNRLRRHRILSIYFLAEQALYLLLKFQQCWILWKLRYHVTTRVRRWLPAPVPGHRLGTGFRLLPATATTALQSSILSSPYASPIFRHALPAV